MGSIFNKLLGRRAAPAGPPLNELYQRAVTAQTHGDYEAAIALFDQVIAADPTHAEASYKRANALKDTGKLKEAIAGYDRAIENRAAYTYAYCNRGVLQHRLGQFDDALASYDRAVALDPADALTHYNRALLLQDLSLWEEALKSYNTAIAINPANAEAQYNRSLAQLCLGHFDEGWRSYEWRWRHAQRLAIGDVRDFGRPLWLGKESIADKRLLIHAEGGLGDTIQFCRYAKLCASRGATVLLEVQPSLVDLLRGLEGVSEVIAAGTALPQFDYHVPTMSLPLAFGTTLATVPATDAYLSADAERVAQWQQRLGTRKVPRIGLVWSGNPNNWIDARRSIPLSQLAPSLPSGFRYICLQRGMRVEDKNYLKSAHMIEEIDDSLLDFPNTAALCQCLDLCISVDTSLAHLSGALGQETWVLLPYNPDWRWLLDRGDTPWYSHMRLYRQHSPTEWGRVFDHLAQSLKSRFPPAA